MKYFSKSKYIIFPFLIGIIILLLDLYVLHGFIIGGITTSRSQYGFLPQINTTDSDSILNYDFTVKWDGEDSLAFNLRNNGLSCQYIIHYRDGELFSNIKDELASVLPSLYEISSPYKTKEHQLRFDCGTGLGISTFCPLESVNNNINLKDLATEYYRFPLFDFFKIENDSIGHDITNNYPVFKIEYATNPSALTWNTDYICNEKDSIELQFHYPMHSVWDKKERKIYSNKIKIPYCKITTYIINHFNNHPNETRINYAAFSKEENL